MVRLPTLAALVLAALPAAAQSPTDRFFPTPLSCYARDYTAEHLAGHPQQRASSMALTPLGRTERFLEVLVTATLRDGPGEPLTALAYCENIDDSLYCTMEGDAGAFSITAARDGAVLVEVSSLGMSFEGAVGFVTFERDRGDDRSFLLRPTRDCR
jgi:hypothetical protein